jgi:hypothetical protein
VRDTVLDEGDRERSPLHDSADITATQRAHPHVPRATRFEVDGPAHRRARDQGIRIGGAEPEPAVSVDVGLAPPRPGEVLDLDEHVDLRLRGGGERQDRCGEEL